MESDGAKPRRTQADRRAATRALLLDATVQCLIELGYARTTTTEVVRRAGLSQGALFKHFATRDALIAAAAETLFAELREEYRVAFVAGAPTQERVLEAVRRLWEIFCHPRLRAAWVLYAEAPADPELRAALRPVAQEHALHVRRYAHELFPQLAASPELDALFDVLVLAMQGASLQRGVWIDPEREARALALFESLAVQLLSNASPTA